MDGEFRESYPNIQRWFLTIASQSYFFKAFGRVDFCKVAHPPFIPKKLEEDPKKDENEKIKNQDSEDDTSSSTTRESSHI
mmetsp:Transcript_45674/g.52628  ORF Transcript_45674/g.52628 Transcript_45674/m.52628 type:complete len:80 (+) Transcript_45674:3-242(+)